jgi:toxin ParE1/3/4
MPRYRISEAARADVDAIWLYIAEQGSLDTADQLIDTVTERFPLLAANPGMGRERNECAPGLRSFPVGDYLIFYRRAEGHIDIVRVLHGSRDLSHFFMH